MICRDCKYFNKDVRNFSSPKMGTCNHVKMVDDVNFVDLDHYYNIDGILATCDEQRGELYVGDEFGCIHFTKP